MERLNRFFSSLEWRWSLWKLIQGSGLMASFGLPAWAAWAADILSQYSPFSWVAAGFLGLLIATSSFAMAAWARERIQIIGFRRRISDASIINPLDRTFENKRIRIQDLAPPVGGLIKDKVFVNCDIIGPASVIFIRCPLTGNFVFQVDGLIVREAKPPTNGFGFVDCNFSGCRFYALTFMVPEVDFGVFSPTAWPAINWITETPEPSLFGAHLTKDNQDTVSVQRPAWALEAEIAKHCVEDYGERAARQR